MLTEFRAKYLAKLLNLKIRLLERYPDRAQRIEYIVDVLSSKLQTLSVYTLDDYLFTVHLATREFKEFEELVPPHQEVEELFEGGE
jgi:hypothetical protein